MFAGTQGRVSSSSTSITWRYGRPVARVMPISHVRFADTNASILTANVGGRTAPVRYYAPMVEGGDDDDLSNEIATTDKYRARSKSVAALTAAAAGALAAALALNPALVAFPFSTRVLGVATVVLLVLATGSFVVGSVLHGRSTTALKAGRAVHKALRPWESLFASNDEWPSADEYRSSIESVQRQIMRATDIGMWLATAAIVSIIAALVSMLWSNEQRETLTFRVIGTSSVNELCPALPKIFEATVTTLDLHSSNRTLALAVAGDLCDAGAVEKTVELTVARAELLVIRPAAQ